MRSAPTLATLTLTLCTFLPARSAPQTAGAAPPTPAPVAVPQGDGAPVITDGIFSPGEWDDALRIAVATDVALHLKEHRGVVYVGVRGTGGIGPSELSLATPSGSIQTLHVSYSLYEVAVPATGPEPRPRIGFTSDWYANELRRDDDVLARLKEEGKPPFAADYPHDGLEFAIRRSKLPGSVWRLRLWVTGLVAGKPGAFAFPPAAAERSTEGWLELRLR
jgi:hypothetical protein